MKARINGQDVDLKGAKTPRDIAKVLREHLVSVGADPNTMQALQDEEGNDDNITMTCTFGIKEEA